MSQEEGPARPGKHADFPRVEKCVDCKALRVAFRWSSLWLCVPCLFARIDRATAEREAHTD